MARSKAAPAIPAGDDSRAAIQNALSSALFNPGEFDPNAHGLQVADHELKLNPGQTLVAKYLGHGPKRVFQDEDGKEQETITHRFQLNDGGTVILGGKTILDSKLEGREEQVVGVQFLGMGKGKRGQLGQWMLFDVAPKAKVQNGKRVNA
jgi:hypothetical protein